MITPKIEYIISCIENNDYNEFFKFNIEFIQEQYSGFESMEWLEYCKDACSLIFELKKQNQWQNLSTVFDWYENAQFINPHNLLCLAYYYELEHKIEKLLDNKVYVSRSHLNHFYENLKKTHNLDKNLYKDLDGFINKQSLYKYKNKIEDKITKNPEHSKISKKIKI